MSLADEIRSIPPDGGCCTTGSWYDTQDTEVKAAFDGFVDEVRAGRRKEYQPLWKLCCQYGLEISSRAFRDHIRQHHKPANALTSAK